MAAASRIGSVLAAYTAASGTKEVVLGAVTANLLVLFENEKAWLD